MYNLILLAAVFAALIFVAFILKPWKSAPVVPVGYTEVPLVEGALPLFGHGLAFNRDVLGFIRSCYLKYGKVFRLKIFRNELVVVCDRTLTDEFFNSRENEMSMYQVLDRHFLIDAFTDRPESGSMNIRLIKSTVGVKYEKFAPKIADEAAKLIERLKEKKTDAMSLTQEMMRFAANTSSRCFIGFEMDDEFYEVLMKFTHLQNHIVILTYFLPKWLLRLTLNQVLRRYRKYMTGRLASEIEKYRADPELRDSLLLRRAVDYQDEELNRTLSNEEIGDIVVCLLYVSSENTALGISAAVTELIRNPECWDKVRDDTRPHLENSDFKGLFASPLLDAVVMETARLNSHMFALNRTPVNKKTLGNYYIGDSGSIALAEPMMMKYDCAGDRFENPQEFDPQRFLEPRLESKKSADIMTWGAGIHTCPGKSFAIYEIKAAVALITNNFVRPTNCNFGALDYFSPSAFAERKVKLAFVPCA
eukprot:TRINITY_DN571_c0_g1_i1.p2 TRINITY_DN571_c0_g1~~TRINITY_DN571_c0_g1_i1.p2  ORF type:complete len:476 (-),score=159.55 TRINITY_DN571_c0_g1_i1:60-1487(-)